MKKLYSLFALGALLFAACSDNASQISGSTSVPNMGNNLMPKSPVLCSVMGVTDSLEAIEKGCIWSPEMWSRTSGYRVRTGFDNGTNTSGIWTWHVEQGYYNSVSIDWPGTATAEYDSMALADVIDKWVVAYAERSYMNRLKIKLIPLRHMSTLRVVLMLNSILQGRMLRAM